MSASTTLRKTDSYTIDGLKWNAAVAFPDNTWSHSETIKIAVSELDNLASVKTISIKIFEKYDKRFSEISILGRAKEIAVSDNSVKIISIALYFPRDYRVKAFLLDTQDATPAEEKVAIVA